MIVKFTKVELTTILARTKLQKLSANIQIYPLWLLLYILSLLNDLLNNFSYLLTIWRLYGFQSRYINSQYTG